MSNHYITLGIDNTASVEEIKNAYKKLVKRYHPDVGDGSDAEKFDAVRKAYTALTSPEPTDNIFGDIGSELHDMFNAYSDRRPDDSVNDFFGDNRATPFREDRMIRVTADELAAGHIFKTATFRSSTVQLEFNSFDDIKEVVFDDRIVAFMLTFDDPFYTLEKDDSLSIIQEISIVDLWLGGTIKVRLPGGKFINVNIPLGTSPTARLRIKGKGVKLYVYDQVSDLYIHFEIVYPTLSVADQETLRSLL